MNRPETPTSPDLDRWLATLYDELRQLASGALRSERANHTLQPTALVHEVYLRLRAQRNLPLEDRAAFFSFASTLVRRILVDHARRRARSRREDKSWTVVLHGLEGRGEDRRAHDILALHESLDRMGQVDERLVRVVELRCFGGLTVPETAAALGTSERTAAGLWALARGWLRRDLQGGTETTT
ncbi:MAG: ECF-type sigma factor [Planctomycetota bacterium]